MSRAAVGYKNNSISVKFKGTNEEVPFFRRG